MNVSNCPRCGRIFFKNVKNLCPDCIREDEQMYEKVYRYLRENPKSTVMKVAAETGVPEDRVLAFLREGRIQATEWMKVEYPCERCGAVITSGRYCESCSREVQDSLRSLANQIRSDAEGADQRDRLKYHTEDRLKGKK